MTTPDPWAFQRWAYAQTTGNTGRKAVLLMLSTLADAETGRCEARQATLAKAVEAGERTVRRHLDDLEAAGLIARRAQYRKDGKRRGDEYMLRAPWVTIWPDGEALPANLAGHDHRPTEYPLTGIELAGQELPLQNVPLSENTKRAEPEQTSNGHLGAQLVAREEKIEEGEIWPPPTKLFGRLAPASLVADAIAALAHYCEQTGQQVKPYTARGKPTDSLTRIMRAMDDYPEVRVVYRRMIDHTLASQWWGQDEPHVGVIFGPGAVQQSIQRAHRRPLPGAGMKLTPTGQALRALRLAASEGVG